MKRPCTVALIVCLSSCGSAGLKPEAPPAPSSGASGSLGAPPVATPGAADTPKMAKPAECQNAADCNIRGAEAILHNKPQKAAELFGWACDQGHGAACMNLGNLYTNGALPNDPKRATELYLKGCEANDHSSCANAGVHLHKGDGVDKDSKRALALFDKGCSGDDGDACFFAGLLTTSGDGVPKDEASGAKYFARSCDLGHALGCNNAGILHYKGQGIATDQVKAASFFDKGCAGNEKDACYNLALAYVKGHGVNEDRDKAQGLMQKACKLKKDNACTYADELAQGAVKKVAGANVNVGELTANGLTVRKLSCRLGGVGIFGSMAVVAGLAKQKQALDRCAPAGAAVVVTWQFTGNRVISTKAEGGSPAVNQCVERVMKRTVAVGDGECAGMILIGNKQGAEKAAGASK